MKSTHGLLAKWKGISVGLDVEINLKEEGLSGGSAQFQSWVQFDSPNPGNLPQEMIIRKVPVQTYCLSLQVVNSAISKYFIVG